MHLIFDTETTGLPQVYYVNEKVLAGWPYIVQLSYVMFDAETQEIVGVKNHIINVPVIIPEESRKIHHISTKKSQGQGLDIQPVLNEFFEHLRTADSVVGHNVQFDINMIRAELLRLIAWHPILDLEQHAKNKANLAYLDQRVFECTMRSTIKLCNLVRQNKHGNNYLKFPKLVELHEKLFDSQPLSLHNSLFDVLVALRCYIKIKENRDLLETSRSFEIISHKYNLFKRDFNLRQRL